MSEPSAKDIGALVDRLLLEQGRLDPLELLLAAELLDYTDYEAWRTGHRPDLQGCLRMAPDAAAELLERAGSYALGQKLAALPLEHGGWGGPARPLRIGEHARLVRLCGRAYERPADRPQLDLFQDSGGVLLEDAIRRALAERRPADAREQAARLMRQDPRHERLRGYLRLIQAIDDWGPGPAGADARPGAPPETPAPDTGPEQRLAELDAIEPLAEKLLGHRARDFLAPLWTALAESLAGRPFDPGAPRLHGSFAWARAGRWEAVRTAIEAEPDWRDRPDLVLAHAEACQRRQDMAAARRDWMGLAWEHPADAERALASPGFPDRRLARLWGAFRDEDQDLDTEDFPVWLLLRDPGSAAAVPPEGAPADERGEVYRLAHRLVCGQDDIAGRRALAEIRPDLLQLYLKGLRR